MDDLVSRSRSLIEGKGAGRRAAAKAPAPVTHVPDEPLHGGPEVVSDKTLHTPSYNGFVTPVEASKNAHWYASRPLPATPTSKAKMTDRPNTSGGPGSKKAAKNDFTFDKRVSRDDFYVGSRTFGGNRSGPFAPLRVHPPTPDAIPRTAPVPRFASKTSGLEPTTNQVREAYSADIGMALGSPSHPPDFSDLPISQNVTQPRRREPPPFASPPMSRSSSVDTFDMPVSRKPTGKWKLFSIFTRKQSDQSVHAVSISDPNGLYGTNRPEDSQRQVPPSESGNPARSNTTNSRKVPRHKPIVIRSQTMPLDTTPDTYDQRPHGGERKGDGSFGRIPIALDTGAKPSLAKGPLLNVEIPDVRMERYSVMFNSVLNSNPSLLSRRQATVPKLKSIEDGGEREEEEKLRGVTRRVTSPQPAARGSGLALFPTSRQPQNLEPPKLSPRLRSNTSPAFLPSPSKAVFDHYTPSYSYKPVAEISSLRQHKDHISEHHVTPGIAVTEEHSDTMGRSVPPPPPQFNNDHSNLIIDSPTEIESPSDDVIAWKPPIYQPPPEPKWQMISPSQKTPSTASSYTGSYRKRSPSLASSSRTHVTRPSEDLDDVFYADSAGNGGNGGSNNNKMTPAEISIARQISLSRQQRKLLQPLRTGPSPSVSPGRKPSHAAAAASAWASPMPGIAVTESGRIAETKTSTPTLVHPPGLLDPQVSLAQHRKSERVVLEDA